MNANVKTKSLEKFYFFHYDFMSFSSDAADEIFNQWYDRAKAYAGGTRSDDDKKAIVEDTVLALKTLFGSYGHVLERRADGWIEE